MISYDNYLILYCLIEKTICFFKHCYQIYYIIDFLLLHTISLHDLFIYPYIKYPICKSHLLIPITYFFHTIFINEK